MSKAETKNCPKCYVLFECNADNITACQCSSLTLSLKQRSTLKQIFETCICHHCLLLIQKELEQQT